jgi:predicted O-linked N-acetylglucosamine transferase (SPINDLY family)
LAAGAEVDVLIYPDLGMEPLSWYLSFARLAPVQMAWWGHPVTTGLPSIDYFISLHDEAPHAQQHYSEQLIRMRAVNAPDLLLVSQSVSQPVASPVPPL